MNMKKGFLAGTAIIALSMTGIMANGPAHAQAASPAASSSQASNAPGKTVATSSPSSVDDIVVTARRSAENIQSVPVSVTAFSAASLRERSISTLEDLQIATPGVTMIAGNRQNVNITIRGQSKATAGISSPAVLSYFAEVPNPNYGSYVPQFDISSIQVLKGPQGTLFGRNTTGGAVLYTPAPPTGEFGGYVMGGIGNYDNREVQAVVNIPVNESIRLRLGGDRQKREGYTHDLSHPDRRLDDINDYTLRGSLWLEPFEGLTNTTIVDYYHTSTHGEGTSLFAVPDGTDLLTILGLQVPMQEALAEQLARGPRTIDLTRTLYVRSRRLGITNRTEWDLGGATLINIFGYRDARLDYSTNSGVPRVVADGSSPIGFPAGLPIDFLYANLDNATHQISDELQLHGKAFNDRLDWLIGAFYYRSTPSGPSGQLVAFAQIPGFENALGSYSFVTEDSRAIFGHVTYNLDDLVAGLQIEAGVRYTKDKIQACTGTGPSFSTSDVEPNECLTKLTNPSILKTNSSAPTWSIGLNWQASDNIFAYIVSRRGYRAGGVNSPVYAGRLLPFQSFSPETVTDVEAGIRTDTNLGGNASLRFNISGFVGWYKNVQTVITGVQTAAASCDPNVINPVPISPDGDCNINNDPSGGTLLVNLGESRVSGIDVDGTLRLSRALSFNFGANFLEPKTTSFTAPPAISAYVTDQKIPFNFAADRTFTLGARLVLPVSADLGEIVLNADYYNTTKIRYSGFLVPGYDLVNARIDWNDVAGSKFDLSLFARNVLNNKYPNASNATGAFLGLTTVTYGPPRMVGLELRYRFGS